MKGMRVFLVFLCAIFLFFVHVSVTFGATPLPKRITVINRYIYETPLPRAKAKSNQGSLLSQIWQKIGPSVLGSGGVILGAAIAWYTLRRKTKSLDKYFNQISTIQEKYRDDMPSLKRELVNIQEQVEMDVARKKLDQEQLIAISNKIDRIIGKRN